MDNFDITSKILHMHEHWEIQKYFMIKTANPSHGIKDSNYKFVSLDPVKDHFQSLKKKLIGAKKIVSLRNSPL